MGQTLKAARVLPNLVKDLEGKIRSSMTVLPDLSEQVVDLEQRLRDTLLPQ